MRMRLRLRLGMILELMLRLRLMMGLRWNSLEVGVNEFACLEIVIISIRIAVRVYNKISWWLVININPRHKILTSEHRIIFPIDNFLFINYWCMLIKWISTNGVSQAFRPWCRSMRQYIDIIIILKVILFRKVIRRSDILLF